MSEQNKPVASKQVEVWQRRAMIRRLVESGITNQNRIKEALTENGIEISQSTVYRDIQAISDEYREMARASVEAETGKALAQIDQGIQRLQAGIQAGDVQSHRMLRDYIDQKARLLGMYKPSKHAITDPTGEKEYTGIPEERKQRILQRMGMEERPVEVEHDVVNEIEEADVVQDEPDG